jgi:FAD/FMN-containing dehydrogenase
VNELAAGNLEAAEFVRELKTIVGSAQVFAGDAIDPRYRRDLLGKFPGRPGYVVRPASVEEVAAVMRLATASGLPVTPLGGRSGTVGGTRGVDGGIILSLERMNSIREVDVSAHTMTVEAGVVLQAAQEAAEAQKLLLPLDLGARGSATIGGAIATNAGGNRVLRWGMMRDMVLGVEAVLADGSIVRSLGKVLKDNAGYDWKQLMIGSEGTLGVVTAAVLRLRPLPTTSQTALLALDSFDKMPDLLRRLEGRFAGTLSSFEAMWGPFYEFVSEAQLIRRPRPMRTGHPFYVLIETLGAQAERDRSLFEEVLAEAIENDLIADAVIAGSERERINLWAVREELREAFRSLHPVVGFDISMTLADMPGVVTEVEANLPSVLKNPIALFYGHAGDGNLHIVVSLKDGGAGAEHAVELVVYSAVQRVGGSVAAEHGIGRERLEFIGYTRSPEELALMRRIKSALDPLNILNPGVLIPVK